MSGSSPVGGFNSTIGQESIDAGIEASAAIFGSNNVSENAILFNGIFDGTSQITDTTPQPSILDEVSALSEGAQQDLFSRIGFSSLQDFAEAPEFTQSQGIEISFAISGVSRDADLYSISDISDPTFNDSTEGIIFSGQEATLRRIASQLPGGSQDVTVGDFASEDQILFESDRETADRLGGEVDGLRALTAAEILETGTIDIDGTFMQDIPAFIRSNAGQSSNEEIFSAIVISLNEGRGIATEEAKANGEYFLLDITQNDIASIFANSANSFSNENGAIALAERDAVENTLDENFIAPDPVAQLATIAQAPAIAQPPAINQLPGEAIQPVISGIPPVQPVSTPNSAAPQASVSITVEDFVALQNFLNFAVALNTADNPADVPLLAAPDQERIESITGIEFGEIGVESLDDVILSIADTFGVDLFSEDTALINNVSLGTEQNNSNPLI